MLQIIKVIRIRHWSKNLLIFVIPLLSGNLIFKNLWSYIIYFLVFSLFVSGTYVINDLIDIESDKKHPTKKNRPIASGLLSKKKAVILSSSLLLGTIWIAFMFSKILLIFLILYFLLATSYSYFFKFIKYFDLFYLTSFFILRIILGAYLFETNFTDIFILFTFFSTGTISIAKKYSILNSELINDSKIKSSLNKNYSSRDLLNLFIVFAVVSDVIFAIWIFSNNYLYDFPIFMKIILYVIVTLFLYNFYKYTKNFETEDIIDLILRKKELLTLALLFVLFLLYGLNTL